MNNHRADSGVVVIQVLKESRNINKYVTPLIYVTILLYTVMRRFTNMHSLDPNSPSTESNGNRGSFTWWVQQIYVQTRLVAGESGLGTDLKSLVDCDII
jgi:hypothetical protein